MVGCDDGAELVTSPDDRLGGIHATRSVERLHHCVLVLPSNIAWTRTLA